LNRYFSEFNTENWVDAIDDITEAINNSKCRITGMRPNDITEKNANALWHRLYDGLNQQTFKPARYKKGDSVRMALETPVFRKGTLPTFTDEIFRVDSVVKKKPVHYYLSDYKGEPIKGRVYGEELTKTRESESTTYRIEKIIMRRRGKALVKFIGYPDSYWIKDADFVV
jgi:hypothetical protein